MDWPTIEWSQLVSLEYWLEGIAGGSVSATPPNEPDSFFFWFWLNVFSVVLISGVVARIAQAFLHDKHPFQSKLPFWGNNLIWMGVLGLSWFLMRQIEVGFLGARIWVLAILVWAIVIALMSLRYFMTFYPIEREYFKAIKQNEEKAV